MPKLRHLRRAHWPFSPAPNPNQTRSLPILTQRRSWHQFNPSRPFSGGDNCGETSLSGDGLKFSVACLEPQHQPGGVPHIVFVGDTGKPSRHPVHLRQPRRDERQDFDIYAAESRDRSVTMGYGRIMIHRRVRTTGPGSIVDFAHVDTGRLFMAHALFVAGSTQAFLFVFPLVVLVIIIIFIFVAVMRHRAG